jgi:protein SCO1/2
MLCTVVLNSLVSTLNVLSLEPGRDFDVVAVSFDPREKPALAAAKKTTYLERYSAARRANAEAGWHFLTGDQPSIASLTDAVGFRYVFDPEQHEYAHPSGLVVLTQDGTVSRYLYGLDFEPNDLRLALVEASQQQIATTVDRVLLLCYHYDPANGRYSSAVLTAVQAGGVATMIGLGLLLGVLWRRDLRASRPGGAP